MDELEADLRIIQKLYIIDSAEKKDIRVSINRNREWAILIEIISVIGEVIKPFVSIGSLLTVYWARRSVSEILR
jgi:hypothetical protein